MATGPPEPSLYRNLNVDRKKLNRIQLGEGGTHEAFEGPGADSLLFKTALEWHATIFVSIEEAFNSWFDLPRDAAEDSKTCLILKSKPMQISHIVLRSYSLVIRTPASR
jgi:hypothetical protein